MRLGATVSADFLSETLSNYPATPPDLAAAVRDLIGSYQETTLLHLSEALAEELDPIYARLDAAGPLVDEACSS